MHRLKFRHISEATAVTLCMLLLVSCMSNAEKTFGRGGLENANVVANVLDDVGVYEKKKEPVDYSPRPPLDIPNSTENLPKPKINPQNQDTDEINSETAESESESPDLTDQSTSNDEQSSVSETQDTVLSESATEISQNDLSDSLENEIGKNNLECELYPADEENDCHLLQPPEDYN